MKKVPTQAELEAQVVRVLGYLPEDAAMAIIGMTILAMKKRTRMDLKDVERALGAVLLTPNEETRETLQKLIVFRPDELLENS